MCLTSYPRSGLLSFGTTPYASSALSVFAKRYSVRPSTSGPTEAAVFLLSYRRSLPSSCLPGVFLMFSMLSRHIQSQAPL